VPGINDRLALQISHFVHNLRDVDLYKLPGVAETLDWGAALMALSQRELSSEVASATLGAILKHQEDIQSIRKGKLDELVAAAASNG
jgi:hypothetical protein